MTPLKFMSEQQLVVRLAVITASKKIEKKVFGSVPVRNMDSSLSSRYWDAWDSGFDVVNELVQRRRISGNSVSSSYLWDYIDDSFKNQYESSYDYCRPVTIDMLDFEALCKAIYLENDIQIGSYRLKPLREDFISDGYGGDNYGTVWGRFNEDKEMVEIDESGGWYMALELYALVNGERPDKHTYGDWAERLDSNSWSVYDPPYLPLRKRVLLGYE
ncbi:hypothetical protein L1D14_04190 [Vibrio tubiashii]|uniref:hypothetical protein n=1 Tax=Vibrio tubiashii TaxID=29498 RepID=UPI001EFC48BA|nr:hypothetical protein [Vibrio tubiashii]MCG9575431.1 hypothetical protein [Vibrio tubiashii]